MFSIHRISLVNESKNFGFFSRLTSSHFKSISWWAKNFFQARLLLYCWLKIIHLFYFIIFLNDNKKKIKENQLEKSIINNSLKITSIKITKCLLRFHRKTDLNRKIFDGFFFLQKKNYAYDPVQQIEWIFHGMCR